ncbi:MAG: Rrf2 family protein [Rhodothermales bacterium]|jgi:Rrf2 family protein
MKISSRTIYGLRVLFQLAMHGERGELARCSVIAQKQDIAAATLDQVMVILKKAGLVRAQRGRKGGYTLASPPAQITLLAVLEAFEGPVNIAAGEATQGRFANHATTAAWQMLGKEFCTQASATTLADIIANQREKMTDFVI